MVCSCETFICAGILFVVVYKLLDWLVRIPYVGRFSDRYILVTGCDSGFGKLIAQRLDRLGCHVFAGCLTEVGQLELQRTASDRLHAIPLDVTDHNSVLTALANVKSKLPSGQGLWGILNNAGIIAMGCPIECYSVDTYRRLLSVNTLGMIDVTMTFLPLVKKSRGRVVNMSSINGRFTMGNCSAYGVSKYGVEAFTDGLRRSLRVFGCKVAMIEPGAHKTPFTSPEKIRKDLEDTWKSSPPEVKIEYGEDYFQYLFNTFAGKVNQVASDNFDNVLKAYEHALLGRFPRARYVVGLDAKWIMLPLQYLPEWLGDWIIELLEYDPRKPIPAALRRS